MSRNLAPIVKWGTDKKYKRVEDFLLRPSVEEQAMQAATRSPSGGESASNSAGAVLTASAPSTRRAS